MISHGCTRLNAKLLTTLTKVLRVLNRVKVVRFHLIKEDVAVRRDAVLQACFATTGKGDVLRIRAPSQLLNAAKGFHRAFVRLAFEDIKLLTCFEIEHKRMLDALHIVVPMAIHQVVHDTTCGFWKVLRLLFDDFIKVDALQDNGFLAVWSDEETLDLAVCLGQLLAFVAVHAHFPNLSVPKECDGFIVQPLCIGLVLSIFCQLFLLAAISLHHPKNLVALVFCHAVIAHLEHDVISVGRGLAATYAAHCPKCF